MAAIGTAPPPMPDVLGLLVGAAANQQSATMNVNTSGPPEELMAQCDTVISAFEAMTAMPQLQAPNPAQAKVLHAYVGVVRSVLEYARALVESGDVPLSKPKREKLADLIDRASELADTFSWGISPEPIRRLIQGELCE